jgi:hypothetical protein
MMARLGVIPYKLHYNCSDAATSLAHGCYSVMYKRIAFVIITSIDDES